MSRNGARLRLVLALALAVTAGPSGAQSPTAVPLPPPAPLPKEGLFSPTPLIPPPAAPAAAPAEPRAEIPPQQDSGFPTILAAPGIFGSGQSGGRRPTTALDPKQRALIERVNSYLNNVSSLVGSFVQVGPDGTRSEGQFSLQKPGKVRFEYNPPSPVELIADGSAIAVRDRKLATQDIYPLSQTPLRFLLAEKIDLLRDTNVVGVYRDDMFVTVVIEERTTGVGTHRLMIMFGAQDNQLKQWTITDPQGYDTTIAVYNLDQSKRPDPRNFRINYERMLQ